MKTPNKRTRILLSIGILLVVVVVAGAIAFSQLNVAGLSGAAVMSISPAHPTVAIASQIELVANNAIGSCGWTVANSNVVKIAATRGDTLAVLVKGLAPGV